tara:strand:- start:5855 stop:6142 length:288 start_codon:yes stop_codon:yes gene_type:complete
MPAVAIAPGTVVDTAGTGAITASNVTVKSLGKSILVVGDVVAAHTAGATTHPATTISTGSATVKINGKPVAYSGSVAGCAGAVATSFNPTVSIGA